MRRLISISARRALFSRNPSLRALHKMASPRWPTRRLLGLEPRPAPRPRARARVPSPQPDKLVTVHAYVCHQLTKAPQPPARDPRRRADRSCRERKMKPPKPFDARAHLLPHRPQVRYQAATTTALSTTAATRPRSPPSRRSCGAPSVITRLIALPAGAPYPAPAEVRAWPAGAAPVDWGACGFSKCGARTGASAPSGRVGPARRRRRAAVRGDAELRAAVGARAWRGAPTCPPTSTPASRQREYLRYFFTAPAFLCTAAWRGGSEAHAVSGALDVAAMREAAGHLVGHDFEHVQD